MEQVPKPLTVSLFGAGQDSTWLLWKLGTDAKFYKKHIVGDLLVIGSDTGDEHDHTKQNIEWCKRFAKEKGIEFYWITKDMGFHGRTWQSLFQQYERNSSIGSAAFKQTCTDNLKVKVCDRFLETWIMNKYGYTKKNKKSVIDFYNDIGKVKIRYILGFAKGEESRTVKGNKYDGVWKKTTCKRYFVLIKEGIDRQRCIDDNTVNIPHIVWPSNCMRCFYQSDQEVLWLYRFYPHKFYEWVTAEKAKITKYSHRENSEGGKNFGVYGTITLEEKLTKAINLYGHWSDEQLNDYKMSHGHCIKTTY